MHVALHGAFLMHVVLHGDVGRAWGSGLVVLFDVVVCLGVTCFNHAEQCCQKV